MAEETQLTANTGLGGLSVANTNLDGTGIFGVAFNAGATNGSFIKRIFIKACDATTQGMIRLFLDNGNGSKRLLAEVEVDAVTRTGIDMAFTRTLELDLNLVAGGSIVASTQNAERFRLITEAYDWSYYATDVRTDTTQFTAKTGSVRISTANSNNDGTGTLGTVLTAGASGSGWKGCRINCITIKALENTTRGMVRLFIEGAATNSLIEVPVPAITASYAAPSFSHTIYFDNPLLIAPGYILLASTENAEEFVVTADGEDWKYL